MTALPAPQPPQRRRRQRQVPRISWRRFVRRFRWNQGEHVSLIGPTGRGKTTLALQLLPLREYVLVLAVKPRDPVLDKLVAYAGYQLMRSWEDLPVEVAPRVVLAPPAPHGKRSLSAQAGVFSSALESVYRRGGWCVYADEVRYLTQTLGLKEDLELLWQQGRSLGVSVVAGMQRPRHVPLLAYDQASHLFFWHDADRGNLDRIAEIGGGIDRQLIMRTISTLRRSRTDYGVPSDILYVDAIRDELVVIDRRTIPSAE